MSGFDPARVYAPEAHLDALAIARHLRADEWDEAALLAQTSADPVALALRAALSWALVLEEYIGRDRAHQLLAEEQRKAIFDPRRWEVAPGDC